MKKYILLLFILLSGIVLSQDYNNNCVACAESGGFYCGDDESNWTQYSPEGCVPGTWLNDGWEDCIDASDEQETTPTTIIDCAIDVVECDTVYVDVIEYINLTDTIIEIQVIEEIDTLYIYEDILDTLFIEVIETEWIYIEEYVDCDTGLPCNTEIIEIIKNSEETNLIYNLKGQVIRKPESIYIQNGKVKWLK